MTYMLPLLLLLQAGESPSLEVPTLLEGGSAQPADEAATEPGPTPEPEVHPVVPLLIGETAPWSGLLVDETTFTGYLTLQLKIQELEGLVQIRTDLADQQRTIFENAIAEATVADEESWWDRYGFTVGIIVGVVTGVGLMFGGMALLEYV